MELRLTRRGREPSKDQDWCPSRYSKVQFQVALQPAIPGNPGGAQGGQQNVVGPPEIRKPGRGGSPGLSTSWIHAARDRDGDTEGIHYEWAVRRGGHKAVGG